MEWSSTVKHKGEKLPFTFFLTQSWLLSKGSDPSGFSGSSLESRDLRCMHEMPENNLRNVENFEEFGAGGTKIQFE